MLAYILIPVALFLLLLVLCREIKETYELPSDITLPHHEQQPDPVKGQEHAQKGKDVTQQINKLRVLYGTRIGPENLEDDKHGSPHDHQEMPLQPSDPVVFQRARGVRIREDEEDEPSLLPQEVTPLLSIIDVKVGLETQASQTIQDQEAQTDEQVSTCETPTQVDVERRDIGTMTENVVTSSISVGDPLDQTTQGVQCDVIREIAQPIHFTVTGREPVATENQEIQTSVIIPLNSPQDESISPIRDSPESAVLLEEELQGVAVENILQHRERSQDRSRRRSVVSQLAPILEEEVEESPLVRIRRFDDVFDDQDQFHLSRVISTQSMPISQDQSSLHIGINSFHHVRIAPVINRPDQSFNVSDVQTVISRPLDQDDEVSRFVTVSPMTSQSPSRSHEEEDH